MAIFKANQDYKRAWLETIAYLRVQLVGEATINNCLPPNHSNETSNEASLERTQSAMAILSSANMILSDDDIRDLNANHMQPGQTCSNGLNRDDDSQSITVAGDQFIKNLDDDLY